MKKTIEIPDELYEVLEEHKKTTGRPITGMIQEGLYRWMVHERLVKPKTREINMKRKEKLPEELKFCDGDKCNV